MICPALRQARPAAILFNAVDLNQTQEIWHPYCGISENAKESHMKLTMKILAAAAAAALILVSGSLVAVESAVASPIAVSASAGR